MRSHLVIPDTQVKEGVPTDHLKALGNYIIVHQPDVIVHLGDHYDMPSLNSHEKAGSKYFHDLTYKRDIDAGEEGLNDIFSPLYNLQYRQRINKKKEYRPRTVYLMGNHEHRIERAVKNLPILEGVIGLKDLVLDKYFGEVYRFLEIVNIDGIRYSHYFVNPTSVMGAIVGGTIDNKLRNLGFSFTMGHQQGLQFGRHDLADGSIRQGLVAGSFYMHDEDYRNIQGNKTHWRGIVHKRNVVDGEYDVEFIGLDTLLKEYL